MKGLARIRDFEIGYDGLIYLLLEKMSGSKFVRRVPVADKHQSAVVKVE